MNLQDLREGLLNMLWVGKRRRRYIAFVSLSFSLLIIYILINAISIWQYSEVDEKQSADVAIVLGAGNYNGEVSPVFAERINHAIWLYENGYARKILMTGGYGSGSDCSDARAAKIYACSKGVLDEDILVEEKSEITQENIQYAKVIMEEAGYETAIIVSDPLHMKRSMRMARDYGMEAYSSPTPTSRYISLKTKLPFLGRELFFYIGYKIYRLVLPN